MQGWFNIKKINVINYINRLKKKKLYDPINSYKALEEIQHLFMMKPSGKQKKRGTASG